MWKGLALQSLFLIVLWFVLLHFFGQTSGYEFNDLYGLVISILNFTMIALWFVYTLVLILKEKGDKYIMDSVFVELYVMNLFSLIGFSVWGITWFIIFRNQLDIEVDKLLILSSTPFTILLIFTVILMV